MSSIENEKLIPAKLIPLLITFAVGVIIWFIPPPEGVKIEAWRLLAIFIATIVGIVTKPLPMGAIAMIGITAVALSGVLDPNSKKSIQMALSGFSNHVIWLIVSAFFISRGFIKTGLGNRIAYMFMSVLGKKTLGLAYGMIATDLILAPVTPSNTARSGGIIYPIVRSICHAYGSEPDDGTAKKIGSFLIKACFQGVVITSAMFMTAMAANPLASELASKQGAEITWVGWAIAAIVPGLISLIVVPYVIYKIYPPEVKDTPQASQIAKDELKKMGPMKTAEWIMLGTFVMLLTMWIFSKPLGIYPTVAAFIGLAVLFITGVLTWKDILSEKGAWDTLTWFAALVMMASYLNKLGLVKWFGDSVGTMVSGYGWILAFVIVILIYFYSHYFFASATAHVSAMYAAFLAVAVTAGAPVMLAALILAFFSNLFASTTHYGTGPAPVLFGSGYVEMKSWWSIGLLISVINIVIWLGVGGVWWKVLGLW